VTKGDIIVWGAKFSKDENEILSWSDDKIVRLWDKKSGKELLVLKHNDSVWGAKFSKDGNEILSWSEDGVVKTYKLYRDRKLKKEYYPLEAEVESGCTLTKSGEVRALNKEEWEEKKRRYEEALKESE
jgi:WD40 repeat protein